MASCHCMREGFPVPCPHMVPCGPPNSTTGFVQCCYGIDTCGADLFCHDTSPKTGESGYYAGGCTDAIYRDDSCSTQCGSQTESQAVYSQSTGDWTCCYDNAKGNNCSSPTNITFKAPSPEVLFAAPFSVITASETSSSTPSIITVSTSSSSTSSIIIVSTDSSSKFNQDIETPTASSTTSLGPFTTAQTVTTTVTTTVTASAGTSSGLSTEAKAGIGVGAVVLLIIGLAALLFLRRRSLRRQQQPGQLEQPFMRQNSISKFPPEVEVRQLHEVDASERVAEAPSYTELPYNSVAQHSHTSTGLT